MSTNTKKAIRDIKDRRFQFLAIIMILTLGASMYFGLSMLTIWREESLNYSYDELLWEDLQIDLLQGTYINNTVIQHAIEQIPSYRKISDIEFRLVINAACNISNQQNFTIIPCKIIGVNVSNSQTTSNTVNRPYIESGRIFDSSEFNKSVAIVDRRLFKHYSVNLGGNFSLFTQLGNQQLKIIASATFPEYLVLLDDNAMGLFAEKQYTVTEIPLLTLQHYFLLPGRVNQIVLRLKDSSDVGIIGSEIKAQLEELGVEISLTLGQDHPVSKMLYEDIENDNILFMLIALLFLISGGFGSYVTINRLATSQKREIGISLAIGYRSSTIVRNYLFFPFIVSLISTLGTIILGIFIAQTFWNGIIDMLGFPYLITTISFQPLSEALVLVNIIPVFATFLAVWRLSRKIPVDLIRFDPRTSQAAKNRSIIEKTIFRFIQIPISLRISFRNVFRHKKRTISTLSGVVMSLCLMGVIWGLIDTFDAGIVSAENDIGNWSARFETTTLIIEDTWSTQIESINSFDNIIEYQLGLQMPIRFPEFSSDETKELMNFLEGVISETDLRRISLMEGELEENGIVLSKPTADKLNVHIGDIVKIEHVSIGGSSGYSIINSSILVTGIHNQIFGSFCFMKLTTLQNVCNASGLVNSGYIVYQDYAEEEVIIDLYTHLQGVNKIVNRNSLIDETKEIFDIFYSIFIVTQVICMILALALIYNSVYSNIHERKREIGTMRTLGTPKKDILRILLIENGIMVLIGIIIGIASGYLLIDSLLQEIINETFPHLFVPTEISIVSWSMISSSVIFVLLLAHLSVFFFLRNLDLVGATKVRE
ncbi:MAG: ABC transporter permease [Candidatus Hodarchaeales archaeon]|jgi:putative ABC transport system permease protein